MAKSYLCNYTKTELKWLLMLLFYGAVFFSFMIMTKVFHFYFEKENNRFLFLSFRSIHVEFYLVVAVVANGITVLSFFLYMYSRKTFKYMQLCILTCTDSFSGNCFIVTSTERLLLFFSNFPN